MAAKSELIEYHIHNNNNNNTEDTNKSKVVDVDEQLSKSRKSSFSSCYSTNSAHSVQESSSVASIEQPVNRTKAPPPLLHEFYHGRSVFITGGTGFVGKVLIEKLLYEFRDIGNIYVLMRPKAGARIGARLEQMIQSKAFDRIRASCPEQFQKIVPIGGDISLPGLGINPLEIELVASQVSVIFHSAATIRFDEPLKYALKINTMGTKRVIELAKRLKNLAAFVHVSTAYCGVNKRNIQERVYLEPISPDRVLQMASFMSDETFDQMKDIFYQGRPCSYHYTKSLAEQLIAEQVQNGYVPTYCTARAESATNAIKQMEQFKNLKLHDESLNNDENTQDNDDDDDDNDDTQRNEQRHHHHHHHHRHHRNSSQNNEAPANVQDDDEIFIEDDCDSPNCETPDPDVDGKHRRRPRQPTVNLRPFPAAIIRPSIITSSWRDPFPGWVDNYNGTTGFLVVNGKGVLRTIHVQENYVTDLIPVDVVISTCISAAWYISACRRPTVPFSRTMNRRDSCDSSGVSSNADSDSDVVTSEVFVVNCVSGARNPLTWADLRDITTPHLFNYPSSELFRVPGVRFHRRQITHQLNLYLEHTIPARITDFVFELLGFPAVMDQVYQKVHRTIRALEHFTTNEWTYSGENLLLLDKAVNDSYRKWLSRLAKQSKDHPNHHHHHHHHERQQQQHSKHDDLQFSYYQANGVRPEYSSDTTVGGDHPFPMDLARLDWNHYFEQVILGIRSHLLREDEKTLPDARRTLLALRIVDFAVKAAVTGTGLYQILYSRSITRQILAALSGRRRQE